MTAEYTSAEVAALFNITQRHVSKLASRHKLGHKLGRDYRFTGDDIERMRQRPTSSPGRPRKASESP